jgi:hypothetical protein
MAQHANVATRIQRFFRRAVIRAVIDDQYLIADHT